jgi:hypothetical protein
MKNPMLALYANLVLCNRRLRAARTFLRLRLSMNFSNSDRRVRKRHRSYKRDATKVSFCCVLPSTARVEKPLTSPSLYSASEVMLHLGVPKCRRSRFPRCSQACGFDATMRITT